MDGGRPHRARGRPCRGVRLLGLGHARPGERGRRWDVGRPFDERDRVCGRLRRHHRSAGAATLFARARAGDVPERVQAAAVRRGAARRPVKRAGNPCRGVDEPPDGRHAHRLGRRRHGRTLGCGHARPTRGLSRVARGDGAPGGVGDYTGGRRTRGVHAGLSPRAQAVAQEDSRGRRARPVLPHRVPRQPHGGQELPAGGLRRVRRGRAFGRAPRSAHEAQPLLQLVQHRVRSGHARGVPAGRGVLRLRHPAGHGELRHVCGGAAACGPGAGSLGQHHGLHPPVLRHDGKCRAPHGGRGVAARGEGRGGRGPREGRRVQRA